MRSDCSAAAVHRLGDRSADPEAEFQSAVAATPVYRLFGLEGLTTTTMPRPDAPLQDGHIGYHLRSGVHNLTAGDWNRFMDFADRKWRSANS